jgi:hypothetical protein
LKSKVLLLCKGRKSSKPISWDEVSGRLNDSENIDLDSWNWDLESLRGAASAATGSENTRNIDTIQLARKIPKVSRLSIVGNPVEYYEKQDDIGVDNENKLLKNSKKKKALIPYLIN